ncbi:GMC family oxidoreductase [Myxococcota bacterium]|nr:GMC family oxidoreductase [Myxococcota bacterium]
MSDDLAHEDGAKLGGRLVRECDVAIVGSGPAGAAAARVLARRGARVVVLEEGPYVRPSDYPRDAFSAMALLYRDLGASLMMGPAPMPFVQGRALGGTSVVNGAISWRLPEDVHAEWISADPALADTLPWPRLVALFDALERDLGITPTDPAIAGRKNALMARGAEAVGVLHRPITRNVTGCRGLGRCLQGCPIGAKASMDRTFLRDAAHAGAELWSSVRVDAIELDPAKKRAVAVRGRAASGVTVDVRAKRGVVLAASAVQSPALLLASGIDHGPTGEHFRAHPGVSMAARFPDAVHMWSGATQGHEVIGYRAEGVKLEVLGYDLALAALRTKSVGRRLAHELGDLDHFAHFGAAIRAKSAGTVRPGRHRARVRYALGRDDVAKLRRGVRLMGELMLAAGAEYVEPGVFGWHERVTDRAVMARFEDEAPWDPRAYTAAVTHMFGTCRMGSDPARSVVRPDFRHHVIEGLWVADSSVFPSNTGVNPQTSILALATLAAESVASA